MEEAERVKGRRDWLVGQVKSFFEAVVSAIAGSNRGMSSSFGLSRAWLACPSMSFAKWRDGQDCKVIIIWMLPSLAAFLSGPLSE